MHFYLLRTKKKLTQTDFSEQQKSTQINEKIKYEIFKRQTEALKCWNETKIHIRWSTCANEINVRLQLLLKYTHTHAHSLKLCELLFVGCQI